MYYASNNGDGSGEIQYRGKRPPSYDDGWCTAFNGHEASQERMGNTNYADGYAAGLRYLARINADA